MESDYYKWAARIAREDAAKYKKLRDNTSYSAIYDKYNKNYMKLECVAELIEKANQ